MKNRLNDLMNYLSSKEKFSEEAKALNDLLKSAGYGDYPHSNIPDEFPSTKAVLIMARHNYNLPLIELFQELGYPPGAQTEDELTRKTFDFSYRKVDKELGGFGKYFYVRPEKNGWGVVMLTDEGNEVLRG